ncbi:MAG: small subunit ribosomal protein S16 [Saprospiraceae bacterium]|jgi:small subunit ribosomal protein S16
MAVKIRLQRRGRKKSPFYHIVIADVRAPRDGRFIEKIGTYNPMTKPATIELNNDRAFQWLKDGAQPTDTTRAILRFKGVMYMKHLQRGVEKGALSQEQADDKLKAWMAEKDAKVQARFDESIAEKKAFYEALAGKTPAKKAAPVVETVAVAAAADKPAKDAAPAEPESETSALDAAVEAVAADPKADEDTK